MITQSVEDGDVSGDDKKNKIILVSDSPVGPKPRPHNPCLMPLTLDWDAGVQIPLIAGVVLGNKKKIKKKKLFFIAATQPRSLGED